MTIPLRSVVTPEREPDDLPPVGGLPRAVVGAAAALVATSLVLLPMGTALGAVLAVPVVLPTVLLVFWPVDVLTRRLRRPVAGAVVVAAGTVVLALLGLVFLFPIGFWAAIGVGAAVGAAGFLAAFLAAEWFGRSKVALIIAAVMILVAALLLGSDALFWG